MKTTKIYIKNLFGITEKQLDGKSVEITGKNGSGKTSVLDAIRYALTNSSDRDYIIKDGSEEGEILIETDTGLSINRKNAWRRRTIRWSRKMATQCQNLKAFFMKFLHPCS